MGNAICFIPVFLDLFTQSLDGASEPTLISGKVVLGNGDPVEGAVISVQEGLWEIGPTLELRLKERKGSGRIVIPIVQRKGSPA